MSLLVAHLAAVVAGSQLALLTLVRVARVAAAIVVAVVVRLAVLPVALVASCSLLVTWALCKPRECGDPFVLTLG